MPCYCIASLGGMTAVYVRAYALGSWYGSIAQYMLARDIACNQLFLIDIDPKNTEYVKANAVSKHIVPITQDCNNTVFEGDDTLVINTSTNDIQGQEWWDHIPPGTTVALQGRDEQWDNKENLYQTLEAFDSAYAMSETYCLAEIPLNCVEGTQYNSFMKIGLK